ncbi:UDP-N-acetylmuramoyl-L-alanyl-D-glutamate--2,6-diaminopimelate ligase [Streptomyces sp. NPDC058700]|uniref:UDP-N-acetylmuramoyl-L-alanyl-D-glutamate--2, 6-diaminopimelate ligase n=1 Tax=Streptomyces sp. NPDC058700 TaxID=3346607 RepID=UPI003665B958
MTTITPHSGNRKSNSGEAPGRFGPPQGAPGTLTAVPHADQYRTAPPRPQLARPTPLGDLAAQLGVDAPQAAEISGITHDSRAVRPGDVYAALPGARAHGADFVAQAAGLGAAAILTDPAGAERAAATGLPVLVVENPRGRMGELAAEIYGRPGADLLQIGITGTSGKTTTAYLVEGGLRGSGHHTGLVGTVEMRIGDERIKSERTTPEATDLQALFAVMRERGVDAVAMEVSSHALVLGRVDGCVFDVAVFNNLSPEHMEFHSDMDDYYRAKAGLFTPERSRLGVVNLDDAYGRRLVTDATVPVVTFSAEGRADADWRAEDLVLGSHDSTFTVVGPEGVRIPATAPLPGPFNVANSLAAIVTLAVAGVDPKSAAEGVAAVPGVPGRLERVDAGQPYLAVVDYAHKTDAVESVLRSLREVTEGRLHVVIGCGGDRDTTKRGPMGAATARLADTAVLTSDNPRSEDPLVILTAMLAGAADVPAGERGDVLVEPDRAAAIAAAVARARPGDTVLVAGKGHEQGQEIAGVVRPFDDREVLRAAILEQNAPAAPSGGRAEASHQNSQG